MLKTIKYITQHPISGAKPIRNIWGFIRWQITSRLRKVPVVYQFTSKSKLWVWNGLTGATGNVYCGLHEFEDMAFLLHFLREDDLFVDVGANIGSYTVLASAHVGARTVSIEPVPQTFGYLLKNIDLNNIAGKVSALNAGVGSTKGRLKFTNLLDTGNHVVVDDAADGVFVDINSLDDILKDKNPTMLKIDVEGFEAEVLKGSADVLKQESLKAIVIELNGSGNRYGFNDDGIHLELLKNGFKSVKYLPFERCVVEIPHNKEHNTLYIRNDRFVRARLMDSPKTTIKGVSF
ncbi:FkbM family methyltransferase [Mucilaginibacter yixingensis]|uniref:FkbM family methyltransferase n=1 Tax=Mucilaginibacter yixingensis TaxID=1295612 RepID=A0A2T5J5N3_9SPHI|nr:FkbM family methyltransferase [Mucilaginibacter yixingensis]PTQ93192.1 FkbM family methyltransferase [Mucilaginibacter yixingensis]